MNWHAPAVFTENVDHKEIMDMQTNLNQFVCLHQQHFLRKITAWSVLDRSPEKIWPSNNNESDKSLVTRDGKRYPV